MLSFRLSEGYEGCLGCLGSSDIKGCSRYFGFFEAGAKTSAVFESTHEVRGRIIEKKMFASNCIQVRD